MTQQTTPIRCWAFVFPEAAQHQSEVEKFLNTEHAVSIFTSIALFRPRKGAFNPDLLNTPVEYLLRRDSHSGGDEPSPLQVIDLNKISSEMKSEGRRDLCAWHSRGATLRTGQIPLDEHSFSVSRDYLRTVYL